jgi:hypothetical protein
VQMLLSVIALVFTLAHFTLTISEMPFALEA